MCESVKRACRFSINAIITGSSMNLIMIHLELQKYIMKMFVDIIYNLEYLALADFPDVFFHISHWDIFVL